MTRRLAAILAVLGILMAARVAFADERVLPTGTQCKLPRGGEVIDLKVKHFAIHRDTADQANACARAAGELTSELARCVTAAQEIKRPEPGWRIAGRWALWGASVAGAFFLGAML